MLRLSARLAHSHGPPPASLSQPHRSFLDGHLLSDPNCAPRPNQVPLQVRAALLTTVAAGPSRGSDCGEAGGPCAALGSADSSAPACLSPPTGAGSTSTTSFLSVRALRPAPRFHKRSPRAVIATREDTHQLRTVLEGRALEPERLQTCLFLDQRLTLVSTSAPHVAVLKRRS